MNAQQLKNSILQEAIQGRLVPQDPTDEPASILLERIRAEKERLVKEGKLKKKDLVVNPISEDEIPFEIPDSWEWVRFGTITINRDSERIPLSVDQRSKLVKSYDYYGASGVIDKVDKYLFDKPLLLIGEDGANLINRSTPIAFIAKGKYWVNNHAHVLDYQNENLMKYMCLYINSISLVEYVTGTAQPKMNQEKMNSIVVALPPLAEQKRIVAKIEELLPKVEEYGKAQEALDKLNAELPDRLKKSVLQEAIEGRLVPQDPNDEPASVLLAKIRKEKEQLVKEGKLKKKDLIETPITEDEIPFDIPDSWEWVRFGTITINRDSERIPLSVDQRSKLVKSYDYYGASGVIDKVDKYLFDKPLLLIGEDGANLINRSTPIAFIAKGKYWVNNHAHVLDYQNEDLMKYMCLYINSISLVEYVTGTAQPKMNQEKMNSIVVALPPLAEQKRIVAKIEEVFAEIDKLKK